MAQERHGLSKAPEYVVWAGMKQRCLNPRNAGYANYGGRGIRICRRWRESFTAFYEDMGPRPSAEYSIDRLDNDGDYEPGNCIWATHAEQILNQRAHRAADPAKISKWQRENPQAYIARITLGRAISRGDIHRPAECPYCGERTRIMAWQPDPEKPLTVDWRCFWCHRRAQLAASGKPVPIRRTRNVTPPSTNQEPGGRPWEPCWGRNQNGAPCAFRGRYEGPDGRFYCAHHSRLRFRKRSRRRNKPKIR